MDPVLELHRIYYDISHPAGYSSVNKLTKAMNGKISKTDVSKWLQSQETYTLHKPVIKKLIVAS